MGIPAALVLLLVSLSTPWIAPQGSLVLMKLVMRRGEPSTQPTRPRKEHRNWHPIWAGLSLQA
ncbi:hypothetical protein BDV06DRAFT_187236 [Aspergillus oleicola]